MTLPRILCGDVLRFAAHYRGDPFHAILTDPPYELGFMGRAWDRSGIAFRSETWSALAELLHPGAFVMAFASARGWHRQAVAMEDAGLIIHPSIFGWSYGSGFPKATRIPDERFASHRYGLQALKPSLEPILVAQKPYRGKPIESITATGAGTINVDGGRIETNNNLNGGAYMGDGDRNTIFGIGNSGREFIQPSGRWPANFYLQHAPGCKRVGTRRVNTGTAYGEKASSIYGTELDDKGNDKAGYADADGLETVAAWECVDGCPIRALGEQSGEGENGYRPNRKPKELNPFGDSHYGDRGTISPTHDDTGTAARFFFNADWSLDVAEQIDADDPVRYQAKAGRRERDAGLDDLSQDKSRVFMGSGGRTQIDGQWIETHSEPLLRRNGHPTVKPIALSRWLSTLLLPPDAYAPRRLLVPFAGVGSEMIGAMLAGWDEVIGVEGEAEYVALARARIDWWAEAMRWGHDKVDSILADFAGDDPESVEDADGNIWQQSSLFGD